MNTRIPRRPAAGLSLIELLVAIAVGGILMGGAISLFVNNRATYEVTNDMARLQENARFALQIMTEDIRMAGHTGCNDDQASVKGAVGGVQLTDLASGGIEGYESGAAAWVPSNHAGEDEGVIGGTVNYAPFMPDSDGITVRYLVGDLEKSGAPPAFDNQVLNDYPDDANELNTVLQVRNLTHALQAGQVAAVTDCASADFFTLTADPNTTGTPHTVTASALSRSWALEHRAMVSPVVGVRYFVRRNQSGVPALYRSSLDPADSNNEITVELVDGVQSLQVLYGTGTAYLSADEVAALPAAFGNVNSVRIALLMQTVDEFGEVPDDTVYDVGAERFCPTGVVAVPACTRNFAPDRRRRRVFQTTVAVRNLQ